MNENMPERTKRALDCERRNHFWNQAMSLLLAKATKKCPMAQQRETKPHAWSYCTCYQSLISFVFSFSVRSEKRAPYVRLLLLDMNGQAHHKIQMMWWCCHMLWVWNIFKHLSQFINARSMSRRSNPICFSFQRWTSSEAVRAPSCELKLLNFEILHKKGRNHLNIGISKHLY